MLSKTIFQAPRSLETIKHKTVVFRETWWIFNVRWIFKNIIIIKAKQARSGTNKHSEKISSQLPNATQE